MNQWLKGAIVALSLVSSSAYAIPTNFSFTGSFATDDEVQLFDFSVAATSTVTLRTWSYAGGTNAAGDLIAAGGFDPILALFDSTGLLIDQNDDGLGVDSDPTNGAAFDTLLTTTLGAGGYTVAIMQFANFATGPTLADGFPGSGTTGFVDFTGDVRTGNWAFDILNVEAATLIGDDNPSAVPEPSGLALLGLGVLALGWSRRRKSS